MFIITMRWVGGVLLFEGGEKTMLPLQRSPGALLKMMPQEELGPKRGL